MPEESSSHEWGSRPRKPCSHQSGLKAQEILPATNDVSRSRKSHQPRMSDHSPENPAQPPMAEQAPENSTQPNNDVSRSRKSLFNHVGSRSRNPAQPPMADQGPENFVLVRGLLILYFFVNIGFHFTLQVVQIAQDHGELFFFHLFWDFILLQQYCCVLFALKRKRPIRRCYLLSAPLFCLHAFCGW